MRTITGFLGKWAFPVTGIGLGLLGLPMVSSIAISPLITGIFLIVAGICLLCRS